MPFYLEPRDVLPELEGCHSALIVVCRFCPATSLAVARDEPFLEPWRGFPNTRAFEEHLTGLRQSLEDHGLATEVFRGNLLNFMSCIWSEELRCRFQREAVGFDAAVVMGCDAASDSVRGMVAPTGCRVVHGMRSEGVWDAKPRVSRRGRISFELVGVTPMVRISGTEPSARPETSPAHS